jgi:hypothetical protein
MTQEHRLPALTGAERDFLHHYLRVIELLGRINPAAAEHTYGGVNAAQALVSEVSKLRDALTLMHQRGETEIHKEPLTRALRMLDAEARIQRLSLPPDPGSPAG